MASPRVAVDGVERYLPITGEHIPASPQGGPQMFALTPGATDSLEDMMNGMPDFDDLALPENGHYSMRSERGRSLVESGNNTITRNPSLWISYSIFFTQFPPC